MITHVSLPQGVFDNPKYQGKHVLLVDNKVLAAGSWSKVSKIFDETLKKTKKAPTLTYIPENEMLVV